MKYNTCERRINPFKPVNNIAFMLPPECRVISGVLFAIEKSPQNKKSRYALA